MEKNDTIGEYITLKYSEDKTYLQQDLTVHYETAYESFTHETYSGVGTQKSGYFVTNIYPGSKLDSTLIFPKNVVFCVDASRSMSGTTLKAVCESIKGCLALFGKNDRFSLISFNDVITTHLNSVSLSQNTISRTAFVLDSIMSKTGSNGSNLNGALTTSLSTFTDTSLLNNIIVFTDGFSPVAPEQIVNTKSAGIFPVGIGSDVSRERLEAIANYHNGFSTFIKAGENITPVIRLVQNKN